MIHVWRVFIAVVVTVTATAYWMSVKIKAERRCRWWKW